MKDPAPRLRRFFVPALLACFFAGTLSAATYLPLSDADLARRSPEIVRARVDSQTVGLERVNGKDIPVTIVTFERLETLKGRIPTQRFRVRLPGGRVGDVVSRVPGTPVFEEGQEVLLFLRPASGRGSDFFLSEFGLAHFEIRADANGRRFALRPAFPPEEDDYLSRRTSTVAPTAIGTTRRLRVADSFERALKAIGSGGSMPAIEYAAPRGHLTDRSGRVRPLFVNIGGREPGDCMGGCLFRWFWDTGKSPNGVVSISGTQSNLSDSSDGSPHVANAVTQWTGIAGTVVKYSGPTEGGNVTVNLDTTVDFNGGSAYNTTLACGSGGVLGLGGTQNATAPSGGYTFKGDPNYYAMQTGVVTMRKLTGSAGCYDFATFRTAVMHELGHSLGLGHPDQGQSTHSTTTSADWAVAVMHSSVPPSHPSTPQTDDVQAIQFYYGTGAAATPTPTPTPTSPSGTPTRTPTTGAQPGARGHVTPLSKPTPKSNTSGRQ